MDQLRTVSIAHPIPRNRFGITAGHTPDNQSIPKEDLVRLFKSPVFQTIEKALAGDRGKIVFLD